MRITRYSIPARVIEREYGENADEVGDDLVHCLNRISSRPGEFPYSFSQESSDPNPHFHALVFVVEGLSDPLRERLRAEFEARVRVPVSEEGPP